MFDFSTSTILLAVLKGLWLTLSPWALGSFLAGLAVFVAVVFGMVVLPVRYRLPAILVGIAALVLGAGWQLALAEGAKVAILATAKAAIGAERTRADLSEAALRDLGALAVRNREEHLADLERLKGSDHAADVNPDRDRIAVPRALVRGLRDLRDGRAR